MQFLYNLLIRTAEMILPVSSLFSPKMRQFNEGRRGLFDQLENQLNPGDWTLWFHAASLGEFEQGVPVIQAVKNLFPDHKIVVSFFSPSGYEIKKKTPLADLVTYLPIDTPGNARKFLDLVHPEYAFFIKYEFWPNLLGEMARRKIPSLSISASFRKEQAFFKPYGGWMRKSLRTFDHFFVQNQKSKELLESIGFDNVVVSGDTRFDRVSAQLDQENRVAFIEDFKSQNLCVVAGSTWPEDEALLLQFINGAPEKVKIIIAPHTFEPGRIRNFRKALMVKHVLYSEKQDKDLSDYKVIIVDTIGLLTRIYSYADIAYVGGAAGHTGLHNILEPATFGIPVLTGTHFGKNPEAFALQELGGLFPVSSPEETEKLLQKLIFEPDFREISGKTSEDFIGNNTGATSVIISYLKAKIKA